MRVRFGDVDIEDRRTRTGGADGFKIAMSGADTDADDHLMGTRRGDASNRERSRRLRRKQLAFEITVHLLELGADRIRSAQDRGRGDRPERRY